MKRAMPVVIFTDLDDTLFSSVRKQEPAEDLEPQAWLQDGSPISFSSRKQRALQHWMNLSSCVIPVTARSLGAFRRVDLRFGSYAVLSHGACVLCPDGSLDPLWSAQVQTLLQDAAPALQDALDAFRESPQARSGALQLRMIEEQGASLYALVKHAKGDSAVIAELAEQVARPWLQRHPGFCLHLNDNNLALIPPGIGKAHAMRHVSALLRAELGEFMSVGMGDSLTDMQFMLECDYALLPGRSQLAAALKQRLAQ